MRTQIKIEQRHLDRRVAQHPLAGAIFDQVRHVTTVAVGGDHVDIEFNNGAIRRLYVRRRDADWLERLDAGSQVKPTTIVLRW